MTNEQSLKVDDHQIALLVNAVTHIAGVYHDNGSLHQRMASEIVPMFQQAIKDARKQTLEAVAEIYHRTYPSQGAQLAAIQELIK